MRLYAQTPARRNRQVLADLIAVGLIAAAVWFALAVHDAIMMLAEPGRRVESSGDSLQADSPTPVTRLRTCRSSATS